MSGESRSGAPETQKEKPGRPRVPLASPSKPCQSGLEPPQSKLLASKGEARKLIQGNGFSVNKEKVTDPKAVVDPRQLINGRYLLLQKGKKDYCLVRVVG